MVVAWWRRGLHGSIAALIGAAALTAVPAQAAARADLKVTAVSVSKTTVVRGGTLKVRDTTRNTGTKRARRSVTRYYLSTNRTRGTSDRLLSTRKVGRLVKGTRDRDARKVRIPRTTKPRRYYVIACADARKQVRETREGNNCRATKQRVRVTAPKPPPPPPPPPTFPMAADPLTVSATLQTERAVTQAYYPHEASTITATAADGTTYTLQLPKDALLESEAITMTPVSAVPGLPMSGGLVAGVQIEPHGLMLQQPATLTIVSPNAGPIAQQTPFLFHEDGEDFHLYPPAMPEPGDDANTLRLQLFHFSTPGFGLASLTDRTEVAAHVPERLRSQVESVVAEAAREARASGSTSGDWQAEVGAVLDTYYDQVVRPHLADAEQSPALGRKAIAEALAWSRQVQLLGDEDNPRHAEIMERVIRILEAMLEQMWNRCSLNHDMAAIAELVSMTRQAQLLRLPMAEESLDKAQRCAHFEVRFTSRVTHTNSWSGDLQHGSWSGVWATAAVVEVSALDFDGQPDTGVVAFTEFSFAGNNTITDPDHVCHTSDLALSTAPGRMIATVTPAVQPNVRDDGDETVEEPPPPPNIHVGVLVPGTDQPSETYQRTACDGSTSTSTDHRWASYFSSLFFGDRDFVAAPAEQVGEFITTRSVDRQGTSGQPETGNMTIEVVHTPQR